jgi:dihydroorotate dehydrogenase electron transfer subunit
VTTRPTEAELVDTREILPGQWLQSYHAPDLAAGSRAGQFVQIGAIGSGRAAGARNLTGTVMRRPLPLNSRDAATGIATIHFPVRGRAMESLSRLRPGDEVHLFGPYGRPFEVDPRSQNLLLVAVGPAIAAVRLLVDEAVRAGRRVTLLFGATSAEEVYPSTLLPDEVEYVVATNDGSLGHHGLVTELILDFEAWADQAFASGPREVLAELARLAAGRRERLGVATLGRRRGGGRSPLAGSPAARRKAFLQVSLEQEIGCAVGACLGCVVMSTSGAPQRVCREGPVFASDEIAWEGAW